MDKRKLLERITVKPRLFNGKPVICGRRQTDARTGRT